MPDTPQLPGKPDPNRELGNTVRARVFAMQNLAVLAIEREWTRNGDVPADRLADVMLGVVWPLVAEREAYIQMLESQVRRES